jgi:hypothetical protein
MKLLYIKHNTVCNHTTYCQWQKDFGFMQSFSWGTRQMKAQGKNHANIIQQPLRDENLILNKIRQGFFVSLFNEEVYI